MTSVLRSKQTVLFGVLLVLGVYLLMLRVHLSTDVVHVKQSALYELNKRREKKEFTEHSESSDLMTRVEDQRRQVNEYCAQHPALGSKFDLPREQEQRELLYRHLLFDDLREIMFCFVEKIGCTDMKRLMFIAAGALPERTAQHEWVDLKYLERGIKRASLQNKSLTDFSRFKKIRNYFKFTIMRHPLERLVSGFRNKVEPPLLGLSEKFPNLIKQDILRKHRKNEFQKWLEAKGSYNISIHFTDFIDYFIHGNKRTINPHFKPFIHTCHPCVIRYDFYGNFHHYGADVKSVAETFGLSFSWYRNKSLHSSSQTTRALTRRYYDQLSKEQKWKLLEALRDDLDFYYLLYPDDRDIQDEFLHMNV